MQTASTIRCHANSENFDKLRLLWHFVTFFISTLKTKIDISLSIETVFVLVCLVLCLFGRGSGVKVQRCLSDAFWTGTVYDQIQKHTKKVNKNDF